MSRVPFGHSQVGVEVNLGVGQCQMQFPVMLPSIHSDWWPVHDRAVRQAKDSTLAWMDTFTQPRKRDITKKQYISPSYLSPSPIRSTPLCEHGFAYSAMECAYSCSHWTNRDKDPKQVISDFVNSMQQASVQNHKSVGGWLDMSYGPSNSQKMDIWGYGRLPKTAPVLVFFHGGFWQEGSRQLSTSMVSSLVRSGVLVALVGYDLAQRATLDTMVDQCAKAIQVLHQLCVDDGSCGLYVAGHSAGAHLALMALLKQTGKLHKIKGLFLLSGIYDVRPIIGTYIDKPLKLSMQSAFRNSPTLHVSTLYDKYPDLLVSVVVAQFDSPSFKEQAKDFFNLINEKFNTKPNYMEVSGVDHFTLIQNLSDRRFSLTERLCDWIQLY